MKKEQQAELVPNKIFTVNSLGDKKRLADLTVSDFMYVLFGHDADGVQRGRCRNKLELD